MPKVHLVHNTDSYSGQEQKFRKQQKMEKKSKTYQLLLRTLLWPSTIQSSNTSYTTGSVFYLTYHTYSLKFSLHPKFHKEQDKLVLSD